MKKLTVLWAAPAVTIALAAGATLPATADSRGAPPNVFSSHIDARGHVVLPPPAVLFNFVDAKGRPVTIGQVIYFPDDKPCHNSTQLASIAKALQQSHRSLTGLTYVSAKCVGTQPKPTALTSRPQ